MTYDRRLTASDSTCDLTRGLLFPGADYTVENGYDMGTISTQKSLRMVWLGGTRNSSRRMQDLLASYCNFEHVMIAESKAY